ncbi:MAG: hypothetical protein JWN44_5769 [Myxococcales bacterium]|nr:hypothetical protein [Myxococcales bacterium]
MNGCGRHGEHFTDKYDALGGALLLDDFVVPNALPPFDSSDVRTRERVAGRRAPGAFNARTVGGFIDGHT